MKTLSHSPDEYLLVSALIGVIFLWGRFLSSMNGTPKGPILARCAVSSLLTLIAMALCASFYGEESVCCCCMFLAIFFAWPYTACEGEKDPSMMVKNHK
jgi:fucose permease